MVGLITLGGYLGLGGQFLQAYKNNQDRTRQEYKTHVVVKCVVAFMKSCTEWKGRTLELFDELEKLTPYTEKVNFPDSPQGMTRIIKANAEILKEYDIFIKSIKIRPEATRGLKIVKNSEDTRGTLDGKDTKGACIRSGNSKEKC